MLYKNLKADPVLAKTRRFLLERPDKLNEMQETGWTDLLRYELRTARSDLLRTKDLWITVDLLK